MLSSFHSEVVNPQLDFTTSINLSYWYSNYLSFYNEGNKLTSNNLSLSFFGVMRDPLTQSESLSFVTLCHASNLL